LASREQEGRDTSAIDDLLKELAELRELDRRRQAHAPGSADHDRATQEVDLRGRRLMDRFRDFEHRRTRVDERAFDGMRPVDAAQLFERNGGSRLN
jgi:hypothetical protein